MNSLSKQELKTLIDCVVFTANELLKTKNQDPPDFEADRALIKRINELMNLKAKLKGEL